MPDPVFIVHCERRLLQLGCPRRVIRRAVRELADHHQDLKIAAREGGFSETAAEDHAGRQLGEPIALAEHLAAVHRRASWWGRHPFIGFCWLPLFGVAAALILSLLTDAVVANWFFRDDELHALMADGWGVGFIQQAVHGTYYAAIGLTALLFCWLAGRSGSGGRWALAACLVCAVHGSLCQVTVQPHTLMIGYAWPPSSNWRAATVPLAVGAGFLAYRWFTRRLPAAAGAAAAFTPAKRFAPLFPRTGLITPSSIIATTVVLALALFLGQTIQSLGHQRERVANRAPAERARVMERLKNRHPVPLAAAVPVQLQPWVNLRLNEAASPSASANQNNLAELPAGRQVFGGVPFDVCGRVQLMGRALGETGGTFPSQARDLPIARQCRRIHLLHGACFVHEDAIGSRIASLVIHYADGSSRELQLIAGEHVLDWWGPIASGDRNARVGEPSAAGAELAWVGSNPWIQQQQPQSSLRLYKTTLSNPRPEIEIVSIDYLSAMTEAAPFLLGLTLE